MSFKNLGNLLRLKSLTEEDTREAVALSKEEITRLDEKFALIGQHLESLQTIFEKLQEDELQLTRATKLHHLGHKAGLDMSYFHEAKQLMNKLEQITLDMHQVWMTSVRPDDQ